MENDNKNVMFHLPEYYREFSCIGSSCESTCCASWGISADKKSLAVYRNVESRFAKRFHQSIEWKTGSFIQKEGKCPFLSVKNLCGIYMKLGKEKLCATCRTYPRHMEEYGTLREISLSLSCPEAARLIMTSEKQTFHRTMKNRENIGYLNKPDRIYLEKLKKLRTALFTILENKEIEIAHRMSMILALGHDARRYFEKPEYPEIEFDKLLERYLSKTAHHRFGKRLQRIFKERDRRQDTMCRMLESCGELEPVVPDFKRRMAVAAATLYAPTVAKEQYTLWKAKLKKKCADHEKYMERLLRYFLYVYLLGAVYDREMYGKIKLAVGSCLVIREQWLFAVARDGSLSQTEAVRAAYFYSRELEHSDKNLERWEHTLLKNPAFSLENIIGCI